MKNILFITSVLLLGLNNNESHATTLNVDLYEFSGIGLFEPNNRPELQFFGSLELEMLSCHQMTARITTSDETFTLNMHRLDDVTYTQNCVD